MKNNQVFIAIVVLVALAAVVFIIIKIRNAAQNAFASTPVGNVFGVRSVEASAAFQRLMNIKWLTYPYAVKLNRKYNTSPYVLDYIDTTRATEISNKIVSANSKMPLGLLDDSAKALTAVMEIENMVQAVQVVFAFHNTTGKNLNAGLDFVNDATMIQISEYFLSLPTGIKSRLSGKVFQPSEISA